MLIRKLVNSLVEVMLEEMREFVIGEMKIEFAKRGGLNWNSQLSSMLKSPSKSTSSIRISASNNSMGKNVRQSVEKKIFAKNWKHIKSKVSTVRRFKDSKCLLDTQNELICFVKSHFWSSQSGKLLELLLQVANVFMVSNSALFESSVKYNEFRDKFCSRNLGANLHAKYARFYAEFDESKQC